MEKSKNRDAWLKLSTRRYDDLFSENATFLLETRRNWTRTNAQILTQGAGRGGGDGWNAGEKAMR